MPSRIPCSPFAQAVFFRERACMLWTQIALLPRRCRVHGRARRRKLEKARAKDTLNLEPHAPRQRRTVASKPIERPKEFSRHGRDKKKNDDSSFLLLRRAVTHRDRDTDRGHRGGPPADVAQGAASVPLLVGGRLDLRQVQDRRTASWRENVGHLLPGRVCDRVLG
jgi:hypothetical protein